MIVLTTWLMPLMIVKIEVIGGQVQPWTFGQLRRVVLGTAGGLASRGLPAGSRVLMRLGNTVDFPVAYLAAIAADLVPVPTSASLTRCSRPRSNGWQARVSAAPFC